MDKYNSVQDVVLDFTGDPLVREMAERVKHFSFESGEAKLMGLCEKASCQADCEAGCKSGCQSSCKTGKA